MPAIQLNTVNGSSAEAEVRISQNSKVYSLTNKSGMYMVLALHMSNVTVLDLMFLNKPHPHKAVATLTLMVSGGVAVLVAEPSAPLLPDDIF